MGPVHLMVVSSSMTQLLLQTVSRQGIHSKISYVFDLRQYYGLNCVPQKNSYVEILTPVPSKEAVGDRLFKESLRYNEVFRVGPYPI